jgi:tetratricopeptide (TPR) repeat protein
MILRLSNNTERAAGVVVSFSFALIFSFFSIRNALAVHYAGVQTTASLERATQLEPADPRNWYLLGRYWQYNLEDLDTARAVRSYRTALSLNPVSWETWLDLAAAYDSEFNPVEARDAFLHAKKAYPLSAEVSWQYGNFLLRQGELDPAFTEIRLAIQGDPKRAAEAFSRSLRAGTSIEVALDRVLPPISDAYIDVIRDQVADGRTENALKVWDRLVALHPRVSLYDSFPLVGALMSERRIAEAGRVWDQAAVFAGLADLQGPPGSLLWDGGFESNVKNGGFSWFISGAFHTVQVGIDSQEKHSGSGSLRLAFDGKSNVSFVDVCHYVPIQPSTAYRFSAWVRANGLTTDQGIRFQLHSLGTLDASTVFTPEVHGTVPWTPIELRWFSGKEAHEAQICVVRFPSERDDGKIRGTAWVDDVALVPEPTEHPKP